MIKTLKYVLILLASSISLQLSAQTVYFSGVGRALFSAENMTDQSETLSELNASGGYTMMDLGIWAEPDEVLRANVILRQRSEMGGFFDNGTSLDFRQMQIEGLIAKKIKYEIGDVYLDHTPYTLWNEDVIYNDFESDLYVLRRGIVNYENFFVDNKWRMQGVNTSANVKFEKGIQTLGLRGYGGRTAQTDFATTPDRYFYGARVQAVQSDMLKFGANLAGLSDMPGTVEESEIDYDNKVLSGDFELALSKGEDLSFKVKGEGGVSMFSLARAIDTVSNEFNGEFFDLGAEATYEPLNLTVGVSYRDVSYDFNSPMAQTRRVLAPDEMSLTYFPTLNDDATARPFSLYDRFAQELGMYNGGISTTLMNYYVQYDMVAPYGKATPNRQGITVFAKAKDEDELFEASVEANFLSEGVSEGDTLTQALREFVLVRSGARINIDKMLGCEKTIAITGGVRMESSKRGETNFTNLSSTLIDLGLDLELFENGHLLAGTKLFSVQGEELQSGRDELNQLVVFSPVSFDEKQTIYSLGFRYDYDKKAWFSLQGNMVDYQDANNTSGQFDLNQLFIAFGIKF